MHESADFLLGPPRTLYATCDNFMRIYFDGAQVFQDANFGIDRRPYQWSQTTTLNIPNTVRNVGISCVNGGGPKGILASIRNGLDTSTFSWECTTSRHGDFVNPNSGAFFSRPRSFGHNGVGPWGRR